MVLWPLMAWLAIVELCTGIFSPGNFIDKNGLKSIIEGTESLRHPPPCLPNLYVVITACACVKGLGFNMSLGI